MTFGECFDKVVKLLNYYSSGGVPIGEDDGERLDLRARAAALIDAAQYEMTAVSPIWKQITIFCRAPENLVRGGGFHRVGAEGLVFSLPDARAHSCTLRTSFEMTAEVRQGGRVLASIGTQDTLHMKAYAAVFEPDGGEPVRLVIRGEGLCADVALYEERYASAQDVPTFGLYCDYAMPEDMRRVERVDLRSALGRVTRDTRDYRVREGRLALPWSFEGEARVTYAAYPGRVTEEIADGETLSVEGNAAQGAVYYAAAGLTAEENPELSRRFESLYRGILEKLPMSGTGVRIVPALFSAFLRGGRL